MPKNATFEQRVKWHLAHQKNCSCRPIAGELAEEMLKEESNSNPMLNKAISAFLLAICTTLALGQDSTQSYHGLELSFGINQTKEENLHPKVSTGTITRISYAFEKRKKVWHQFHFTLGHSRLKTQLEDLSKSIHLQLNTAYSWNYPLVQKRRVKYYLGPEASIAWNAAFYPNWDDSHLYWADCYSVGARNGVSIELKNETEFASFLSIPLFSVFSRPELYRLYKIDDTDFSGILRNLNSNLTPAHLVNVFYIRWQTEYRFPVFKGKRQAFTYHLEYNRVKHDTGNTFSRLLHQIGIKLFL